MDERSELVTRHHLHETYPQHNLQYRVARHTTIERQHALGPNSYTDKKLVPYVSKLLLIVKEKINSSLKHIPYEIWCSNVRDMVQNDKY